MICSIPQKLRMGSNPKLCFEIRVKAGLEFILCRMAFGLWIAWFSFNPVSGEPFLEISPLVAANWEWDEHDKEVLRRSTHSVWVDAETESIESKEAKKASAATSNGRSNGLDVSDRHQSVATSSNRKTSPWWESFFKKLFDMVGWIFEGWGLVLLISLVLGLALVVLLVLRNGSFFSSSFRSRNLQLERRALEQTKIRDLPFELEQSNVGLLEQAERYRAVGDYSKAIVYLFSHMLVELDSARCIRIERGKTNRVYLHELRDREWLRSFVRQTVDAFEFAFFGKHTLSRDEFESIWAQLSNFQDSTQRSYSAQSGMKSALLPPSTAVSSL